MGLLTIFQYQPFKAVFTIVAVVFNLLRLPYWMVYYIPSSNRQQLSWTWSQALRVRVVRAFLFYAAIGQPRISMSKSPGRQKARYVVIPPASRKHLAAFTLADPEIKPVEIGGTWYPNVPNPAGGNKPAYVILHFHGGAYTIGDGRDADAGFAARTMLKHTDATHVFCPQYRLATYPKSRFPAQLQDAIASYEYLLNTVGVPANRIVVSGDSAGGHLSLGLLRYIADHGKAQSLPDIGCAFLWSPWVSPYEAKYQPGDFHISPHKHTDYVTDKFGAWGADRLEPSRASGLTLRHECANFSHQPFLTKTPLWFQAGGSEVLFHGIHAAVEQFQAVEGNVIEYELTPDAPHDITLVGDKLGFVDAAEGAAKKAGQFLRRFRS